ncbi:hypothetical protein [Megalodesulfovibrio paquesii]
MFSWFNLPRQYPRLHRALVCVVCSLMLLSALCTGACTYRHVPPPPRVYNQPMPTDVAPSYVDARWQLTAVSYVWMGQGFDYSRAGLEPVILKVVNTGSTGIQVLTDEVVGIAQDGSEYLVYTLPQAGQMVMNSEYYRANRDAAASTVAGTLIGAGLGSIVGLLVGGGPGAWRGAIIGGAGGAVTGAMSGSAQGEARLRNDVMQELQYYVWKETLIAPQATKVGYFYFPRVNLRAVRVTVRGVGGELQAYELPLVAPANLPPAQPAPQAAPAAPAGTTLTQ